MAEAIFAGVFACSVLAAWAVFCAYSETRDAQRILRRLEMSERRRITGSDQDWRDKWQ